MRQTHLGRIFHVTEEFEDIVDAVLTKGSEVDRTYFESADFDVVGGAILQRHENLSPDGVPERLRQDNILLRHPKLSTDEAEKYQTLMLKASFTYPAAIRYTDTLIRKCGFTEAMSWLEKIADEMYDCRPKDDLEGEVMIDEPPPPYGFHKVDTIWEQPKEKQWQDKQPHIVQRLLTTPGRCRTIEQLTKLGQKCFSAKDEPNPTDYQEVYCSLTNKQQEVFWTNYNIQKKELLKVDFYTTTTKALLKKIMDADARNLRRIKARLWKIQHGQFQVQPPPQKKEFNILYNAYRQREYQLNHPSPEIPDDRVRCGYCYEKGGYMYRPKIDLVTGKQAQSYNKSTKILHCLSCDGFYEGIS
jgi:hypothetical protein